MLGSVFLKRISQCASHIFHLTCLLSSVKVKIMNKQLINLQTVEWSFVLITDTVHQSAKPLKSLSSGIFFINIIFFFHVSTYVSCSEVVGFQHKDEDVSKKVKILSCLAIVHTV